MKQREIVARIEEIDAVRARISVPAFSVEEIEALLNERKELVKKYRRNSTSRARGQAHRDLGLTKTPYGWE